MTWGARVLSLRVPHALAVVGLLAALVAMHHLPAGAGVAEPAVPASHAATIAGGYGDPPSLPAPDPSRGGHHDSSLMHLCLAVLAAAAVLVVGLLMWRYSASPAVLTASVRAGRADSAPRAPPLGSPARLALLCVSRT